MFIIWSLSHHSEVVRSRTDTEIKPIPREAIIYFSGMYLIGVSEVSTYVVMSTTINFCLCECVCVCVCVCTCNCARPRVVAMLTQFLRILTSAPGPRAFTRMLHGFAMARYTRKRV